MCELKEGGDRREWTRHEWRRTVRDVAAGLEARGVRLGDAVAVLGGNSAEALAVAFACWSHGWVYLPLNAHESADRQTFVLRHAQARQVLHARDFVDRAVAIAESVGAAAIPLDAVATDGELLAPSCPWGAAALRVYTSGTTGDPKRVVLTGANLVTDCLVPTILEFLLEQGAASTDSRLSEVFCGAGPLMTETVTAFEERFGVAVRHLYGLSETTAVATMMPAELSEADRRQWYQDHGFPSIGCAVPHVEVAVQGAGGQPCALGVRGEIVVRGATVMAGYADQPEATSHAFRGGWFHSGDEGFWAPDARGVPFHFVTGRIKELIIRGGVNSSPFEVDEVLNSHPAVRFALAVPFENRYYGEEVAAYVVRAGAVIEEELLDHCAQRLEFAYRPKVVLFGDHVPYTSTGKAKRLALKEQLAEDLRRFRDVQFRRGEATHDPHRK